MDKAGHSFGNRIFVERTVGDAEVATAGSAEGGAGHYGDFVVADQRLDEVHVFAIGVDAHERIESAAGRGDEDAVAEALEFGEDEVAHA